MASIYKCECDSEKIYDLLAAMPLSLSGPSASGYRPADTATKPCIMSITVDRDHTELAVRHFALRCATYTVTIPSQISYLPHTHESIVGINRPFIKKRKLYNDYFARRRAASGHSVEQCQLYATLYTRKLTVIVLTV